MTLRIAGPGDVLDNLFPPPRGWDFHGGAFESPLTALDPPDYTDANGVKWGVWWTDRGDGWLNWKSRPISDGGAASYGIAVDRYPLTGLVARGDGGLDLARNLAGAYEGIGEDIEEYAKKKKPPKGGSGGGTLLLILLGLWLVGSDKRRYVGANDERWF